MVRLVAALVAGALLAWQVEDFGESGDAPASDLRRAALVGAACFGAAAVVVAWAGRRLAWVRRWPTTATTILGTFVYVTAIFSPVDVAVARWAGSSPLLYVGTGLLAREVLFGIPALLLMQLLLSIGTGLRWLAGGLPPGRHPAVEQRLADRGDLSAEQMRDDHFPDCEVAEVRSLMTLFQEEGFPAGRFRPDDDLGRVLEPEPAWNPLRWWLTRPGYEDSIAEIDYRLRRRGIMRLRSTTFRDIVQAWNDAVKD